MIRIQDLITRAKEAFDVANAMEASKPEGVAIQMQSGIVLIGHTQLIANGNAVEDALRSVRDSIPTTGKGKMSPHFVIAAVAIVNDSRAHKPTKGTLKALESYPEVAADAQMYISSAKDKDSPPTIQPVPR